MEPGYRVIFRGGIREGFQDHQVRAKLLSHLNVDAHQIERMFSGQRVVLKKGLDATDGRHFLERLQKMGMDVVLEKIPAEWAAAPTLPPIPCKPDNWVNDSGFADFERTQLNLARAEAVLNGNHPESCDGPFSPPDLAVQEDLASLSRATTTNVQLRSGALDSDAPLVFRRSLLCQHCGSTHQLEASIRIKIA